MIKLEDVTLSVQATNTLGKNKLDVSAVGDFEKRAALVKTMWDAKKGGKKTWGEVKEALVAMSGNLKRCCYCEDNQGDEIEHIRPKSLYPDNAFDFDNYLLACGICNPKKNNYWAVYDAATGQKVDMTGLAGPPMGDDVFVNPRIDDPLDFFWLDLDSGILTHHPLAQGRDKERAEYTRDILQLNRDVLKDGRSTTYELVRTYMKAYADSRADERTQEREEKMRKILATVPHRTVFAEMRRRPNENDHARLLAACAHLLPQF